MRQIIFFCFILIFFSCGPNTEQQLEGHWTADLLTERKDTLDLPPNSIHLIFFPNKKYEYRGTLRYREAGTYRTKGRIIYTTDTLNSQPEKAVHIESLRADSLIINMIENRMPRRLELHRKN